MTGAEGAGTASRGHTEGRLARFVTAQLPLFSACFLGLAAVRVWLQCVVYDLYAATDSGTATIAINLMRAAVTALLMLAVARHGFPKAAQTKLAGVSAAAMTFASALMLVAGEVGLAWLGWAACALGAFGIVWGGGIWITFYQRLSLSEAFLYAFATLALSCLAGLVLGLIPRSIAMLVAVFMPALSMTAWRASMERLDEREAGKPGRPSAGDPLTGGQEATTSAKVLPTSPDAPTLAYDSEPRSTFARLLGGVALFSLALGFARGFPYGQAVSLSAGMQAFHQLGASVLCMAVVAWALVMRRRVRFSLLWGLPLALLCVGVLLLASLEPRLSELGSALVTIANTFTLGVLWIACCDVARHSSVPAYMILGATWIAHQLPRELGRLAALAVGPYDSSPMLLAVCMVALLAASMTLLVNDGIPRTRPLFAQTCGPEWKSMGAGPAVPGEPRAAGTTLGASPSSAAGTGGKNADARAGTGGTESQNVDTDARAGTGGAPAQALHPTELALLLMAQNYQLTRREVDIARLLLQGKSKASVGEELCLSESTVRTHARNLYAKLDVHSRDQLAALVASFK